jgi:4-amino-4-deoxy-L-arabinose transferase-like glycosyltransferase
MKRVREPLLLLAACAVLYLTGAADIPFYTRGEPREGLVVREMLAKGEWLVPARPDGEPARKPPLYYWAAAAATRALPDQPELALRLPSAVLATGAVLATWATARAVWGAPAGLPAALVLATTFEWTRAATSARVDMTLTACLTAVLAAWTLALAGRGRAWWLVAAAGMALGTLAKGPVALVLPALAAGVLLATRRDVRPLRPVRALVAAAVVAGAWYGAAFLREGSAFLDVVARENWLRFVDTEGARTGHSHGPAYLVPLGLVGLLPWTPLLPLALVAGRARPRSSAVVLVAAWAATGLVFFSAAAAKRSAYLLPLFPALALVLGAGIAAATADGRPERLAARLASLYVPGGLALAAAGAALALGVDPGAVARSWLHPEDAAGASALARAARAAATPMLVLAGATAASLPLVARAVRGGRWQRVVVLVAALAVAWTASFDRVLHPAIALERSVKTFLRTAAAGDGPLYALFPADPGVRFYAPPTLRAWPAAGAEGGRLILWEDEWRRLRDAAGNPLPILATSDVRQSGRGRLLVAAAPRGRLVAAPELGAPSSPRPSRRER